MTASLHAMRCSVRRMRAQVDRSFATTMELKLTVGFTVEGEATPATWGPNGGEPADFPEVELVSVKVGTVDILDALTEAEKQALRDDAAWRADGMSRDDQVAADEARADDARGN